MPLFDFVTVDTAGLSAAVSGAVDNSRKQVELKKNSAGASASQIRKTATEKSAAARPTVADDDGDADDGFPSLPTSLPGGMPGMLPMGFAAGSSSDKTGDVYLEAIKFDGLVKLKLVGEVGEVPEGEETPLCQIEQFLRDGVLPVEVIFQEYNLETKKAGSFSEKLDLVLKFNVATGELSVEEPETAAGLGFHANLIEATFRNGDKKVGKNKKATSYAAEPGVPTVAVFAIGDTVEDYEKYFDSDKDALLISISGYLITRV